MIEFIPDENSGHFKATSKEAAYVDMILIDDMLEAIDFNVPIKLTKARKKLLEICLNNHKIYCSNLLKEK